MESHKNIACFQIYRADVKGRVTVYRDVYICEP